MEVNNSFLTKTIEKQIGLNIIMQRLQVHTPYGKKAKDRMTVFLPKDINSLQGELALVEFFKELIDHYPELLRILRASFREIKDIEGSLVRVMGGEVLNELELFEIKSQVISMENLRKNLQHFNMKGLTAYLLHDLSQVLQLLDPEASGINSFYLYDCYSETLGLVRRNKRNTESLIAEENLRIKNNIYGETGIKPKLNGEIHLSKIDHEKVQLLKNCPLVYITSEGIQNIYFKAKASEKLLYLTDKLDSLRAREEEEELKVRKDLSRQIKALAEGLMANVVSLGKLDLLLGKVLLANSMKGSKPVVTNEPILTIKQGRHILVEETLGMQGMNYTPIDIALKEGVTLITGANMGGKTVALKLVAMVTALTQLGLFVPAEAAVVGMVNFIYFSTGDDQSIEAGLSTFGAEMVSLARVLKEVDQRGLLLIDELARGTNPHEGFAITKGVIQYLQSKPTITVITTHYDGLNELEGICHLQVVGLKYVAMEKLREAFALEGHYPRILEKYMDYRLEPVIEPEGIPMEALKIAELIGIQNEIISTAKGILAQRLPRE